MDTRKIIQYQTVGREKSTYSDTLIATDDIINKLLTEDWQPFGGISVYKGAVVQVMVKYAEEEEKL